MNAIEMKQVTKTYGDFTLDNINLVLPQGTILGLVGENGAGKSTSIRLIMDAIKADSGAISVLGTSNQSPEFTALKQDIGVVLDEAYFPEVLHAKNINQILKDTYIRWDEAAYFSYIKRFRLPLDKKFKDFSRGMKMKLAIAVALSHDPKLLILDEATGGLDPMVRDEILDIFNEFTRDETHSILLSSHIVSDLEKICDYIAVLHKGRLVLCEEKDRMMEKYAVSKLTEAQFESLPAEAVLGKKRTGFGYEVLVKKNQMNPAFPVERTTLEDIILFLTKEDK